MDPYAAIGLRRNPDGSLTRILQIPRAPPSSYSKDVPLNSSTNTSLRLFLPPNAAGRPKLPIIIYAAGGGFVIHSSVSSLCHDFCCAVAHSTPAIVVSVEYRDAPEHRLPAAYDDYDEAVNWVKSAGDDWIRDYADMSNCYLMGTSTSGNIVLQAGLRAAACAYDELKPFVIKGLILHQPFFGGVERAPSEIVNSTGNKTLPLPVSDLLWELSLPVGADRDHEYSNPMNENVVRNLDKIKDKGWKVAVVERQTSYRTTLMWDALFVITVAVTGCGGDTLIDRQKEVAAALEEKDVTVVAKFVEGEYHGYDILELSKSELVLAAVKESINN